MPTSDLFQALPGLILAAILPGFLVASLVAPRWLVWERLATAPGLSAGFLGVLGLALHVLHIPFNVLTTLMGVAGMAIAYGVVLRRRGQATGGLRAAPTADQGHLLMVGASLLAGAFSVGALAYALRGYVLPPDWDPPLHGQVTQGIATVHDIFPLLPYPFQGTSTVRTRSGFEATAAMVSWLGGPRPAASMMPVVAAAVFLMPLGLAMLALQTTMSKWIAALAPLLSTGLLFPANQVIVGRYPLVMDATLVAPALVAMHRLVQGRDSRSNAVMLAAITAAIWVTHGLEALTAVVIGGPLIIGTLITIRRRAAVVRLAIGLGACAAGAALVSLLTRPPRVPPELHPVVSSSGQPPPSAGAIGSVVHFNPHLVLQYFAQADLATPVAVLLLGIGIIATIACRQLRWTLVSSMLVVIAVSDTFFSTRLSRLWTEVFPWADTDRLLGIVYWTFPLIMALGLVWAAQVVSAAAADPKRWQWISAAAIGVAVVAIWKHGAVVRLWDKVFGDQPQVGLYPSGVFNRLSSLGHWLPLLLIVAAVLASGWLALRYSSGSLASGSPRWTSIRPASGAAIAMTAAVALVSVGAGAHDEQDIYAHNVQTRNLVTSADLTVLDTMSNTIPPASLVLTDDPWDAGMWVGAVTQDTLVLPKGYEGPGTELVTALDNACTDPVAAAQAVRSVQVVFVGAHHLPEAPSFWNVDCIDNVQGLKLIASASAGGTQARAYLVTTYVSQR